MQAAGDSATVQLRRRVSSPLNSAERAGQQTLIDFSTQHESDMSADLCSSELHSPSSMNSSASSEKMLSHSDRNNSDISEGCPSPYDKDGGVSDSEFIPDRNSPHSIQGERPDTVRTEDVSECGDQSNDEKDDIARLEAREKRQNDAKEFARDANDDSDHNEMADIVGDASSPGEFLDHALEFINKGGRKSDRDCWPTNDLKKSRSPDIDSDMPATKRIKPNERHCGVSSMYNIEHPARGYYKERRDAKRERSNASSALTPDQKLFVEAFKREIANAAENAAEASALRVLGILEASGIYFGRSPFKNDRSPPSFGVRKEPIASSSPILERKGSSIEKQSYYSRSPPRLISGTTFSEEKDGQIRTSNRSQMCFGTVHMNEERNLKSSLSEETIDLTTVGQRRQVHGIVPDRERNGDLGGRRRNAETPRSDEQAQALSLVTKKRSPATTPTEHVPSRPVRVSRETTNPTTSVGPSAMLSPFVCQTSETGKSMFIPSLPGLPVPSSFVNRFDHPANPLSKFLPTAATDVSEKRNRLAREDLQEQMADYSSPFSLAAANCYKSKNSLKSRVSPLYKDDKRVSPRSDDKNHRSGMALSSSIGLHGIPSSSAFSRRGMQRSPTSVGMRNLRNSGSPDRKPFVPPRPLNFMYPFASLPFLPGVHQNPHFASLLAQMNQRRNAQNDYNDIRNSASLSSERIQSVHQPLRGHPASFLGDMNAYESAYEVDGSSYAFASNMQEGLTPQHLKKAKLIFFYTRYPNANTLKTYFPDVNFTRAITSQLIKWFSNFREFFYIQMEKFARQAVTDGITDASMIRVSRDSELFRVLNLHYNKCNEFYVPEAFVHASEASQREFFIAVKAAKDSDPAWKKVIYKVICKLDSEIPEIFKSPNVLDRLHEIRD